MKTISSIYLRKWLENEARHAHLPILKKWASSRSHVTEMGVRAVTSTWALLAAHPKKLVSIDWDHPPFEVPRDALREVQEVAVQHGIEFQFISGDTMDMVIEETELLFIDTWHTYDQLLLELLLHADQVSHTIIAHDTDESLFPGMTCAIQHFVSLNPHWCIAQVYSASPGTSVLSRLSDEPTNWGYIQAETLREEIDLQHRLYYEECSVEQGPQSSQWFQYRQSLVERYANWQVPTESF